MILEISRRASLKKKSFQEEGQRGLSIQIILKFLLIFSFIIYFQSVSAEIIEQIYYLVDDDFITQLDFESEVELVKKNPEVGFDSENPLMIMSNLIIYKLIDSKLRENNLAIKDSDISNYINVIVERNNLGSIENFISVLTSSQNLSYEEYQALIRRKLSFQYYSTRLISTPPVNNREIEEFYQRNRETLFRVKEPLFNLSVLTMILKKSVGFSGKIQVQNRMLKVKEEISTQKITFEEGVKKYSENEVTKSAGGLLGWVDLQQLGIGIENLKILRSLSRGEISDLIRDNQGISLYKVNDILTEGYIPYELAINESKNRIFHEKQKKAFTDSLKELVKDSVIVAKYSKLKIEFNFSK